MDREVPDFPTAAGSSRSLLERCLSNRSRRGPAAAASSSEVDEGGEAGGSREARGRSNFSTSRYVVGSSISDSAAVVVSNSVRGSASSSHAGRSSLLVGSRYANARSRYFGGSSSDGSRVGGMINISRTGGGGVGGGNISSSSSSRSGAVFNVTYGRGISTFGGSSASLGGSASSYFGSGSSCGGSSGSSSRLDGGSTSGSVSHPRAGAILGGIHGRPFVGDADSRPGFGGLGAKISRCSSSRLVRSISTHGVEEDNLWQQPELLAHAAAGAACANLAVGQPAPDPQEDDAEEAPGDRCLNIRAPDGSVGPTSSRGSIQERSGGEANFIEMPMAQELAKEGWHGLREEDHPAKDPGGSDNRRSGGAEIYVAGAVASDRSRSKRGCGWEILPQELVFSVFQRLPARSDRLALMSTCATWRSAITCCVRKLRLPWPRLAMLPQVRHSLSGHGRDGGAGVGGNTLHAQWEPHADKSLTKQQQDEHLLRQGGDARCSCPPSYSSLESPFGVMHTAQCSLDARQRGSSTNSDGLPSSSRHSVTRFGLPSSFYNRTCPSVRHGSVKAAAGLFESLEEMRLDVDTCRICGVAASAGLGALRHVARRHSQLRSLSVCWARRGDHKRSPYVCDACALEHGEYAGDAGVGFGGWRSMGLDGDAEECGDEEEEEEDQDEGGVEGRRGEDKGGVGSGGERLSGGWPMCGGFPCRPLNAELGSVNQSADEKGLGAVVSRCAQLQRLHVCCSKPRASESSFDKSTQDAPPLPLAVADSLSRLTDLRSLCIGYRAFVVTSPLVLSNLPRLTSLSIAVPKGSPLEPQIDLLPSSLLHLSFTVVAQKEKGLEEDKWLGRVRRRRRRRSGAGGYGGSDDDDDMYGHQQQQLLQQEQRRQQLQQQQQQEQRQSKGAWKLPGNLYSLRQLVSMRVLFNSESDDMEPLSVAWLDSATSPSEGGVGRVGHDAIGVQGGALSVLPPKLRKLSVRHFSHRAMDMSLSSRSPRAVLAEISGAVAHGAAVGEGGCISAIDTEDSEAGEEVGWDESDAGAQWCSSWPGAHRSGQGVGALQAPAAATAGHGSAGWSVDGQRPPSCADGTNRLPLSLLCLAGVDAAQFLSERLDRFNFLSELHLVRLPILELPASVGQLTRLTSLRIEGCPGFYRLPESVEDLSMLEELSLWGLPSLSHLPSGLSSLSNLSSLRFCCGDDGDGGVRPPTIPSFPFSSSHSHLSSLTLGLHDNATTLPGPLARLTALTSLDLGVCFNWRVLSPLSLVTTIRSLSLRLAMSSNSLLTRPTSLHLLPHLSSLSLVFDLDTGPTGLAASQLLSGLRSLTRLDFVDHTPREKFQAAADSVLQLPPLPWLRELRCSLRRRLEMREGFLPRLEFFALECVKESKGSGMFCDRSQPARIGNLLLPQGSRVEGTGQGGTKPFGGVGGGGGSRGAGCVGEDEDERQWLETQLDVIEKLPRLRRCVITGAPRGLAARSASAAAHGLELYVV